MGISFRGTVTSFNTRFWGSYWLQRLCCALVGTCEIRALRVISDDRLRSASSGKSVPFAPREFGRLGYDTPVAQPTTSQLKSLHTDVTMPTALLMSVNETSCISAGDLISNR